MKSSVFFEAVKLPPPKPPGEDSRRDEDPPQRGRGWILGLLAIGVLLTIGVVFWNQFTAEKIEADQIGTEPGLEIETDQPTPIYDLSLAHLGDWLYFRNVRGEIRRLNLFAESDDPESTNLFPGRICELLKVSPNNQFMLATFRNNDVLLIDLAANEMTPGTHQLLKLDHIESVSTFAFSENSQYGAAGTSSGRLFVWDLINREPIGYFQKQNVEITGVCLSQANELYVAFQRKIERWKIRPDGKRKLQFDALLSDNSSVREMALSRAADMLVIGQYSGILTGFDLAANKPAWNVEKISPASRTLVVSPDRDHVTCATIEGELILYQIETGIPTALFSTPGMGYVTGAAFSEAGDILYTSSTDGLIRIWSVSTQTQIGSIDPADANRTTEF